MKRSEFVREQIEDLMLAGMGPANAGTRRHVAARAAEKAGVVWDPEDGRQDEQVKMLPVWGDDRLRLTADGKWQMFSESHNEWLDATVHGPYRSALAELRDRLLNEREELEKARNLGRPLPYEQSKVEDGSRYSARLAFLEQRDSENISRLADLARRLSLHETRLMAVENASSAQARTMERRLGESLEAEQKLAALEARIGILESWREVHSERGG